MLGYLSLDIICSEKRTDNVRGQISAHIFAPNGGYCLFIPCSTNMVSVRVIFLRRFFFQVWFTIFLGVFNKTIIPLALVGYEMIIANSALCASLTINHLISNARLWNNCYLSDHPSYIHNLSSCEIKA